MVSQIVVVRRVSPNEGIMELSCRTIGNSSSDSVGPLRIYYRTEINVVGTLHENLAVPVTAKFRIFPDLGRTLLYAKMLEAAGAQIVTCHGRTREMKGQATGLADWKVIAEVKKALKIPVFANGNVLYREDVDSCLEVTGCDGVMTAEVSTV